MLKDIEKYVQLFAKYMAGQSVYLFAGIVLVIINEFFTLATPFLTRFLVDVIISERNLSLLFYFLLVSTVVLFVLFMTSLSSNYILIRVFKKGGVRLRLDLFKHLQQAPLDFFGETPSGQISYRILQDARVIEDSWGNVITTLPFQLIVLTSGLFMVLWHLKLALFVFLILSLQVVITVKFRAPLLRYSELYKRLGQELTGYTVEHFRKIQLIRSLSKEKAEQIKFLKRLHEFVKVTIRGFMLTKFSGVTVLLVNNLWAFGILWYGGAAVIKGEITLGSLMAFLLFANILYHPISSITNLILSFQDVRASQRRCVEYLSLIPKVVESPTAIRYTSGEGEIEIKNVSFGYNYRLVLHNINLHIPPRTIFALVGPSGVGKTTLCRLLVRFYDPDRGAIYIDGKNIQDISISSLRRAILLMLQNDYVFNGTIWENITCGANPVSQEQVKDVVERAAIDFIDILPDRYNTLIGEGGLNISVGEAQRIALARALLLSPKVVILDEPTSFIDHETEEKIKKSLMILKRNTTMIIIAHRLSTIMIADCIALMQNGTIIEVGNHAELLERKDGFYSKIYSSILK